MPAHLKPAHLRRGHHAPSSARACLSADDASRKRAPRLPKRGENEKPWHAMTRSWWRDCWHSPLAREYLRVDIHGLYRLAMLIDQFWYEPKATLAAEIRLQQQAFGQSPIDRRRLQWEVGRVEIANVQSQQRRIRQAQDSGVDPREALRVVK